MAKARRDLPIVAFKSQQVRAFVILDPLSIWPRISRAVLIGILSPYQEKDLLKAYAAQGVAAMAMELVPRITRAQSMDVLSSQANLAGYRAVLEAAYEYGHGFPLLMTVFLTHNPIALWA